MTYLEIAFVVASAAASIGAVSARPPWRRPHPVRGTIGLGLSVGAFVILVGAVLLEIPEGRAARGLVLAAVGALTAAAVLVAPATPDQPAWGRWAFLAALGWLMYHVPAVHFAAR